VAFCTTSAQPTTYAAARNTEVHVTEVRVFGQNPTVDGTKVTTG
jgi:hypothetical protein